MKRRALLVACPHPIFNLVPLFGTQADIQRAYSHLRSPFGGAWKEDEIRVLNGSDFKTLLDALAWLSQAEVSFFFFAGHGFRDVYGDWLQIHGKDCLNVNDVMRCGLRTFIITDSCRNWIERTPSVTLGDGPAPAIGFSKRAARRAFDAVMSQLPDGYVLIQSCAPGESALETRNGGAFSSLYFDLLHDEAQHAKAISHQAIMNEMRSELQPKGQTPTLVASPSWKGFSIPLALTAKQIGQYDEQIKRDDKTLAVLGLVGLALFVLSDEN